MILHVRRNTPNKIVYLESGYRTLQPMVYKRQLNFFRKVKNDCETDATSSIAKLFTLGMNSNTKFLKHYKILDEKFTAPDEYYKFYAEQHKTKIYDKIQEKYDQDIDSMLGTYKRGNPTFVKPSLHSSICCNENDRRIITRYRTGSHDLKIQSGRLIRSEVIENAPVIMISKRFIT